MILSENKDFPQLKLFAADNICSNEVAAVFTTRNGGVSGELPETAYLKSMNLQLTPGEDTYNNLAENYKIIASSLGFAAEDVVGLHQEHTDRIIIADKETCGLFTATNKKNFEPPSAVHCPLITDRCALGEGADALVTNIRGLLLSVRTADCVPVLLYDAKNGAIGAVHAGWRGTFLQIAAKTIRRMTALYSTSPADVKAAIGPAIGACCYEVGEDLHEKFRKEHGKSIDVFFRIKKGKKPHCDLSAMNKSFLIEAGIPENGIDMSELCTMCNPDLFFSHRRSGLKRGSMAAFIGMR